MSKYILSLDFSIFGTAYLKDYVNNVKEYDYTTIRDNDNVLAFDFDVNLYSHIICELLKVANSLNTDDITFLFRNEDIVSYLNTSEKYDIITIDSKLDIDDYSICYTKDSWIKYLNDNGMINSVNWIFNNAYCVTHNLPDNYKAYVQAQEFNSGLLPKVDKLFISLSPEMIHGNYHSLFNLFMIAMSHKKNKVYRVEENSIEKRCIKQPKGTKYCFATVVTTDEYIKGAIGLASTLVNSKYDFIVICTTNVSEACLDELRIRNIPFKVYNSIVDYKNTTNQNLLSTVNKGLVYNLKYEKVCLLDTDTLVLNAECMDNIFEANSCYDHCGNIVVLDDEKNTKSYVGGIMIIKPSEEVFKSYLNIVNSLDDDKLLDVYAFNELYKNETINEINIPMFSNNVNSNKFIPAICHNDSNKKYFNDIVDYNDICTKVKEITDIKSLYLIDYLQSSGNVNLKGYNIDKDR